MSNIDETTPVHLKIFIVLQYTPAERLGMLIMSD